MPPVHDPEAQVRPAEADVVLTELIEKYEQDAAYNIAYIMAFRGQPGQAFEWLEKSAQHSDPGLPEIPTDPLHQYSQRLALAAIPGSYWQIAETIGRHRIRGDAVRVVVWQNTSYPTTTVPPRNNRRPTRER